jgi:hypothetical protein
MSKAEIIEKTVEVLKKLPEAKGEEVADFADFILKKMEDQHLQESLHQIIQTSDAFSFLNEEEEIYTLNDLKEKF